MTPTAMRPKMQNYGVPPEQDGMIAWSWVDARMRDAHNYWIASTRPDGRPHAAPVWGFWIDGALYFGSDPASRKAKNIALNPYIVVHLESGAEAVMLEGRAVITDMSESLSVLETMVEQSKAKYPAEVPTVDDLKKNPLFRFTPQIGFAWKETEFPHSVTKFVFGG
jgi:nitroimidazol reductase NimA-like FMN-containing flavoprotein (pyridoxamine 5'-phosphate oxidase superfamily)